MVSAENGLGDIFFDGESTGKRELPLFFDERHYQSEDTVYIIISTCCDRPIDAQYLARIIRKYQHELFR